MCRFARLLGRVPIAGRLFAPPSEHSAHPSAPGVLRRGAINLTGEGLTRSFGSGDRQD